MRTRPGQKSIGVPLGSLIFICYYVFLTIAKTISEQGTIPITLALWTPNIIFAIVTLYILRFANRETTNTSIDFILDIVHSSIKRLPKLRKRKES